MCGRTAYSSRSINTAAAAFENPKSSPSKDVNESVIRLDPSEVTNRPNAGPGSTMHIFRRSTDEKRKDNIMLELCAGVWGLIPNNGSHHAPHLLPSDSKFSSSPHYSMFNARSETIYDKRSFSGLIRNGQTCVLAVDGYYEWTKSSSSSSPSSSSSDKRKQPYFVCNNDKNQPLLLAGIWSCVQTGRQLNDHREEKEMLTTFTILTMDAYPNYQWLHPRQPVLLWDTSIALEWLLRPSPMILQKILVRSIPVKCVINTEEKRKQESISLETELAVYPVSKIINDGKYQGADCTTEVKLETVPTVKSYFSPKKARATETIVASSPRFTPTEPKERIAGKHSTSEVEGTLQKLSHDTTTASNLKSYFSPKKAKTEKIVEGNSNRELPSSPNSLHEEHSHSRSCKDTHISTCDDTTASPESWACSQCTYIHIGATKFNYLACEVCGSPRTIDTHDVAK